MWRSRFGLFDVGFFNADHQDLMRDTPADMRQKRKHELQAPLAVELQDVRKGYWRGRTFTPVLNGIDFHVRRGECAFLVGPSGSGKSTLLSIIGCILKPDRGRIWILGEEVSVAAQIPMRRECIGFVFQGFQLIRGLSALDNVCVPLMVNNAPPRASRNRAALLLADVGLGDLVYANVDQLSAGQCQRVALARALANDPELILADEPTAALDADNGEQVMALLHRLITERKKTAIVVTHDPRIFRYADRTYILEDGRALERSSGICRFDEKGLDGRKLAA